MEQTTQNAPSNAGKGLGIAGFVISIIALVLWLFVSAAAVFAAALGGGLGLAGFWLVFSIVGFALSLMGLTKAGKKGGKKGMAVAGLIIGSIAVTLSISTIVGVNKTKAEFENAGLGSNLLEAIENGMEHGMDSVATEMQNISDSLKTIE